MNVVPNECGVKLYMWSRLNVVPNEKVSNEQV